MTGSLGATALLAVRDAPMPTAILGAHGIVAASRTFADAVGVDVDRLTGRRLADLPFAADGTDLDAAALAGTERVVDVRRTGASSAVRLLANPLAADPPSAVVQLDGLTEKEQELHDKVKVLRDLVDNSTALMYVKTLDGRYQLVNHYFSRRFGIDPGSIIAHTDHELFPAFAADAYQRNDEHVLATCRSVEVEEPCAEMGVDGSPHPVGSWLSIKFPLLDAFGDPYALGAISTDITDRKRAEAAAGQARDEAEKANQAKSEFLSRMSHELRNPLNAIIGFGQLLRMQNLSPSAAEEVDHILDAGRHLLELVNEVLDLSWIEAGAPGLDLVKVHACVPLREALELMRPQASERDVELASDLHKALHRYVLADPQRLRQVFLNLLANAIKYNQPGGAVLVQCRVRGDKLRFLVTDTGAGIAEDDVDRLFTPFVRLSRHEPGAQGSGLGLALSRHLVEEMGGKVGIQHTAPGEGSTFFVDLPLVPPPNRPEDTDAPVADGLGSIDGPVARVLYVEDTEVNIRLVQGVVDRIGGIELVTAMQGELGVELARSHRPELVLLDLHLADMSGEEVLRRLTADERTRDIPVIVISADATPNRILELEQAGIVEYLTKPLDVHRFARAVRKALAAR